MRLQDTYLGGRDPFQGDQTLVLHGLPDGARVTHATVKLTPAKQDATTKRFEETFSFADTVADDELDADIWGVTRTPDDGSASRVDVNFHARHTLVAVIGEQGDNDNKVHLSVDMGGALVPIADDGSFMGPEKTGWSVDLTSTGDLPGLTVAKFSLKATLGEGSTVDTIGVDKVTVRSVPTNVTVRLDQLPPFWVRLGELTSPLGETSPDFASALNDFLAQAPVEDGFYALPLVVHSDTLARLDVQVTIDYLLEQALLPPHLPEVTLTYTLSTRPGADAPPLTLSLPRGAIPVTGRATAAVQGEFQPTRIALGKVGKAPGPRCATVSPQQSLAQAFASPVDVDVTGLDLPLAHTEPGLADLHASIVADADGKPSGTVRASAQVRVEKPLPGQSAWGTVSLPAPLRVVKGTRYWIVLQSLAEEAYWSAEDAASGELPLHLSSDGGLSWRAMTLLDAPGPVAADYRLRHTPDRFKVPVQLEIGQEGSSVRRALDEYAPLGRIEFAFDFAARLDEHLRKPELASPCGVGELLVNGDLDDPPPDDATRRLFGFESSNFVPKVFTPPDLSRGVDLSLERFITLSTVGNAPDRIDCAGATPSRTTLDEIVTTINRATGTSAVFADHGRLTLNTANLPRLHSWCRFALPAGWEGTPGRIVRARSYGYLGIGLISLPQSASLPIPCFDGAQTGARQAGPAELFQRVQVGGGCRYRLHFRYSTRPYVVHQTHSLSFATGRWQVSWFDAAGELLAVEGETLDPQRHEAEHRLTAPLEAAQAEIRFVQPPVGVLALDDVSLMPTIQEVRNGDWHDWEEDQQGAPKVPPVGWDDLGGWVEQVLDAEGQPVGVRLLGSGPEDAMLAQTVDVGAGKTYKLGVQARSAAPPAAGQDTPPDNQRARLELRWLGSSPIGAPVLVPLDGRAFPGHAWTGKAPEDATRAEVRLIQPKDAGDLIVRNVSLMADDPVEIPLIFLTEAPGQLTLSDLRVAYDLPD